jgi:regulatory protein
MTKRSFRGNDSYGKLTLMTKDIISQQNLYDAALRYLQRYASSAENLRRVLERRVKRWEIRTKQKAPEETPAWIEASVEKCRTHGYVNDDSFAEQKIVSLRRQGRSRNYILRALQVKGINPETSGKFLNNDTEAELDAARRYVERRRLGKNTDPEARQKNLAKLVRAGFSLSVAKAALNDAGKS